MLLAPRRWSPAALISMSIQRYFANHSVVENNIVQTIENNNKRAMEYKKELRDSSKTVTSASIVGSISVE